MIEYVAIVSRGEVRQGDDDWLQRCENAMRQYMQRRIDVRGLARLFALSPSAFTRQFRERTGSSPHAHFLKLRMREATLLLRSTAYAVWEVGQRCGYRSQATFSHQFKRIYGQSPGAWRRSNRI